MVAQWWEVEQKGLVFKDHPGILAWVRDRPAVRKWLSDLSPAAQKKTVALLAHCAYSGLVASRGKVRPRDFSVAVAVGHGTHLLEDLEAYALVAKNCQQADSEGGGSQVVPGSFPRSAQPFFIVCCHGSARPA